MSQPAEYVPRRALGVPEGSDAITLENEIRETQRVLAELMARREATRPPAPALRVTPRQDSPSYASPAQITAAEGSTRTHRRAESVQGDRLIPALALRNWQQEALHQWRHNGHRGIVQAVTGAGKTRVGVAAVAEAWAQGRHVLVITPSRVLVEQWTQQFRELLPGVAVTNKIEQGSASTVVVTTVQSAINRTSLPFRAPGLLVADECHRYGAPRFSDALRTGFQWRLGLSATVERGDDGDETISSYFGETVFDLGYARAKSDGLIAPFRFAYASVSLPAAEQVPYDQISRELRTARDRLVDMHRVPAEPFAEFMKQVSVLAEDRSPYGGGSTARRYLALFSTRRQLLAETPAKARALEALSTVARHSRGTIVFTQTKLAATAAADILAANGCASAAVHADLNRDEREERLSLFRDRDIVALASPRILDEGVDVPDADFGVVMAANRSRRQMIQRLGRVLRRTPGKTARFVVLYAKGTVEDPFVADAIPDFYDTCLASAADHGRFDLGSGESDALLSFLEGGGEAGGDERGRQTPVPALESDRAAPDLNPVETSAPLPQEMEGDDELPEQLANALLTGDPIKDYLRRVGRFPLLNAAQEVELATAVEVGVYAGELLRRADAGPEVAELQQLVDAGNHAQERMICSNLRLVVSLAKRYSGRGMEFLDLIQEGNRGLIHAVEMFDYKQCNKFSTYATWWIKQAITRAMADQGSLVRLPVHVHEKVAPVNRRRAGLPWREFIAQHPDGLPDLDVSARRLLEIAALMQPWGSLDALTEMIDDSVVARPLFHSESPMDALLERIAIEGFLDGTLGRLAHEDPRAARILRARWGFTTGEPETLDSIGAALGITRERVRQIEKVAVTRCQELASEIDRIA